MYRRPHLAMIAFGLADHVKLQAVLAFTGVTHLVVAGGHSMADLWLDSGCLWRGLSPGSNCRTTLVRVVNHLCQPSRYISQFQPQCRQLLCLVTQ